MPPAPLTEPASLPHEVIAWPENAGGVAALCMVAYHGTTHSSSGGTGEGETMALEHRSWTARRNRTLNHFEVTGVIPSPEERLADGAYVVTTRTLLLKPDHQPLGPPILTLRLYLTQERQFPYTPPSPLRAHLASYYLGPIGAQEDACTKVRIMHNGTTLIEIDVIDD